MEKTFEFCFDVTKKDNLNATTVDEILDAALDECANDEWLVLATADDCGAVIELVNKVKLTVGYNFRIRVTFDDLTAENKFDNLSDRYFETFTIFLEECEHLNRA